MPSSRVRSRSPESSTSGSSSEEEERRHKKRKHKHKHKRKGHKRKLILPTDLSDSDDVSEDEVLRRREIVSHVSKNADRERSALQFSAALQQINYAKKSQEIQDLAPPNAEKEPEAVQCKPLFEEDCGLLEELDGLSAYYQRKHKQWLDQADIPERWKLHRDGEKHIVAGDERLRQMYHIFDNLTYKGKKLVRHEVQVEFMELCKNGLLPKIYGEADYDANQERILEENGLDKISPRVISLQPRREGKTLSVCILALALLLCVPGITIVVFSTGGRISTLLMDTLVELGSSIPGFKERIVGRTNEALYIASSSLQAGQSKHSDAAKDARLDPSTSKLFSYPNNSKGLRGIGGDVLILEEAAYIDQDIFKYNVVPLMQLKYTGVIGISSPSDESNYASTLSEAQLPNGEKIFLTHMAGLACTKCKANPTGKPCPHQKYKRIVSHKQGKNVQIAEALLDAQDVAQEIHGIIGKTEHLFTRWATTFRDAPSAQITESVQLLHTFIDPSANGSGSDFVIVTATPLNGKVLIIGQDEFVSIDSNITAYDAVIQLMYNHFDALFEKHRNAKAWVYIEANLNKTLAAHHGRLLQARYGDRLILERLDPQGAGNVGVWTGPEEKELYTHSLRSLLSNGNVLYANDMVGRDIAASKKKTYTQLTQFTRVVKPPGKDVDFYTPRWVYSGKASGPDDVCLALQALCYHILRQQMTPSYYETCNALGITKT